ncbi:MAG: ferritin family protein, partial [Anaerolineae bacterium]
MVSDVRAALAALAYAAYNERDGYVFYSRIAEHIRDEKGRRMFASLAGDEVRHYQLLAAEYESLRTDGSWLPVAVAMATEVPSISEFRADICDISGAGVPSEKLFPKPEAVIPALDAGTGDLQAIDIALEAEKRGYDIYS